MSQIKRTCGDLTSLLYKIREEKLATPGMAVDEDLVADAMLLFAQLSGQHSKLLKEAEQEYEKIYELRDSCEDKQDELEEQQSYMTYMDTEYDTRPWNPPGDVVKLDQAASHTVIKEQLDTELVGRREMCDYAKTLDDKVTSLRKAEQEARSELERVRKIMGSISTPSFLEGVKPSDKIPDSPLTGPLFTLHQMLSSTIREFPGVSITVSTEDPLSSQHTHYRGQQQSLPAPLWDKLVPDPHILVIHLSVATCVVLRYHPNIRVVSCDDNLEGGVLAGVCHAEDGYIVPHTSISFTFSNPTFTDLINSKHIGRVFCWLQEMCGIPVVTEHQRQPSSITAVKFIEHLVLNS